MGNPTFGLSRKARLSAIIGISFAFFLAEITTGFYTGSLALIADAFHYLNDLIGFIVALAAIQVSERKTSPQELSFGWARAQLLGAFFNGAFLLALGLSITLQSIERFIKIEEVKQPKLVLIVGCVGLFLNIISAAFLHEHHDHGHGHSHGGHAHPVSSQHHSSNEEGHSHHSMTSFELSHDSHVAHMHHTANLRPSGIDLGIMGVLVHLVGDALNNIAVIIAAVIIMLLHSPSRFYADPALSLFIALTIMTTSIPLLLRSGKILLESVPPGVTLDDVEHDLESIPGIKNVHDLHVWRLDQRRAIASAHVVVDQDESLRGFMSKVKTVRECFHAYGIHSATLQPEFGPVTSVEGDGESPTANTDQLPLGDGTITTVGNSNSLATNLRLRQRAGRPAKCEIGCGSLCEPLMCCS